MSTDDMHAVLMMLALCICVCCVHLLCVCVSDMHGLPYLVSLPTQGSWHTTNRCATVNRVPTSTSAGGNVSLCTYSSDTTVREGGRGREGGGRGGRREGREGGRGEGREGGRREESCMLPWHMLHACVYMCILLNSWIRSIEMHAACKA